MMTAAMPIGALTKKIHRQDRPVVSRPPSSGHRQAGDRAPDPERDAAVLAPERVSQQRQGHREHDRAAGSLQGAGQLQHQGGGGEPAQRRGAGEHGQAGQVQPPPPVHVGQAARGQQERGQGQRVRVHDPLQIREARAQRLLDIRQRHVHDRHVQQQHERPHAHRHQRPPLVPALDGVLAALAAAGRILLGQRGPWFGQDGLLAAWAGKTR
jgi:hypothetical protein